MKVKNLAHFGSSPAPKEWEKLPDIAEQRPKSLLAECSLQKLDGLNLCVWMVRSGVYWTPGSDYFHVRK